MEIEDWAEHQGSVDAGWMSDPEPHLVRHIPEQLVEALRWLTLAEPRMASASESLLPGR